MAEQPKTDLLFISVFVQCSCGGVNNLGCQDWSLVHNQYFASVIRLIKAAKKSPHKCHLTINSSSHHKIYFGGYF